MSKPIFTTQIVNTLHIHLNRPEAFNSFNHEMRVELLEILNKSELDDTVRCIVIQGEGKAFCAGQDLKEATSDQWPGFKAVVGDGFNPIVKKISSIPKPIIAAVNGVAAGAGSSLALGCDFVVAKESASFLQAFVNIGLVPDTGGSYNIPRLVGLARAKAACMLGEKIKAKEAEEIGLIYKCVAEEEFEETVNKLSNKLSNMPTYALGMIKKMLNESHDHSLDQQLDLEYDSQYKASESEDYKEGVAAFLEKRKPIFKGK